MSIIDRFMMFKKFFYFAAVGGFGTVLNTGILYVLTSFAGMNYIIASIIATETAIISNFIGNNYITFRDKNTNGNIFRKFLSFQLISLIALVGTIFFLWLFVTLLGKNLLLVWNVLAIIIMFVVNFILNSAFTWRNKSSDINPRNIKASKKKHEIKSILIILFVALLMSSIHGVYAKPGKHLNSGQNDVLSTTAPSATNIASINDSVIINTNPSVNQTTNTTTINDTTLNQTINTATNQTSNTSNNQTIDPSNNIINNPVISLSVSALNNQTNTSVENNTSNNTIDNTTINNTSTNQTTNTTINDTTNTTTNQTINDTTNTTTNQTINDTTNTTTNQTINDTTNTTTNQTINDTTNTTTNQTINDTTNTTTNTTTNQTINDTTNTTSNTTTNTSNTPSNNLTYGTNLKIISTNGTTTYYMREDSNATFYINFNTPNTVTWYVDGVQQGVTDSINATFNWNPGILWIPRAPDYSNKAVSTITAVTSNATLAWDVEVENVINPFFTSVDDAVDVVGSPDTKIHIFTNNNLVNFTDMNVTIVNSAGSTVYQLTKQFSSASETEWSIYIPDVIAPGNNYLTTITGYNNATNTTSTYDIGTSRGHYKSPPENTGSSGGSSGGGGGGSGSNIISTDPELVYLTLEKDVVTTNQTQSITLDAKYFYGGIDNVTVRLLTPNDNVRELPLTLIGGNSQYGTWSTSIYDFVPGQYKVISVILKGALDIRPKEIIIENRSFYYTQATNTMNTNLSLVYSVLNESTVKNGTKISLTLDAADSMGISSVTAYIINTIGTNKTRVDSFYIPLTLTGGNNQYGTWKGIFIATQPDSTYTITNITLMNNRSSKTYPIVGRSVYVLAIPKLNANTSLSAPSHESLLSITGNIVAMPFTKEGMETIIKYPFAPTIIGFILMMIVAGVILSVSKRY